MSIFYVVITFSGHFPQRHCICLIIRLGLAPGPSGSCLYESLLVILSDQGAPRDKCKML